MDFWSVRVDVLGKGCPIPIVSHVFFGQTKEDVNTSLREHMKDDCFLASAHSTGKVGGVEVDVTIRYVQHKGKSDG